MSNIKILVITFLANPTCTNWIYGLKTLGYQIAVLNKSKLTPTQKEIKNWGFKPDEIPIFYICNSFLLETQKQVENALGGKPDILFSWEGALILNTLRIVKNTYPNTKVIHCVNTYPNAVNQLTETRMNCRYRQATSLIDSYIFYSRTQKELFNKNICQSANKPSLIMVEPFFVQAYSSNSNHDITVPQLQRFDNKPHVIFTGRGSELWQKYAYLSLHPHRCRDALGEFFQQLAQEGVHIFLPPQADTKNIPNLHLYPKFSNHDLFTGKFSQYISQFDAHLVMYNEYNSTMRRWVSCGLSTRFAYALTSTAPLAVTKTSKFVEEYWQNNPFGFTFYDVKDLAKSLYNQQMLAHFRRNMEQVHQSYSFESQSQTVAQFFNQVLQTPSSYNQLAAA